MVVTFEMKLSKYAGQVSDCKQPGLRSRSILVEVGCTGFAAHSSTRDYKELDNEGVSERKAITEAAESASGRLWLKRGEPWINS